MISIDEQKTMFLDISRYLKKEITAFAVGGTAMMFLGLKDSTMDIDLVFIDEKERGDFVRAAKKAGWVDIDSVIVYGEKSNKPIILKFLDSRLDLFLEDVINFKFSKAMQDRARIIRQFGRNLILKLADFHDIILMKCATDRLKDIDDARTIIQSEKINWDIIIEEAKNQISLGKERAVLELGSFLEKLLKSKVEIPKKALDKLWLLLERQIRNKRK